MKYPIEIEITNRKLVEKFDAHVWAGRHFLFLEMPMKGSGFWPSARKKRLQLAEAGERLRVYPISTGPVHLPGMTLTSSSADLEPLAAVVADRDLYRAEEDTAQLLVVLPSAPADARLVVECDGQPFAERELALDQGMELVPLAALLAGQYCAYVEVAGARLGARAEFTVAEFSLAPLSARLLEHAADREAGQLSFALSVESWQQACGESLEVSLLDDDRPVDSAVLRPEAPGRYRGVLKMEGEGPFRLEARVETDPGRIATVSIPGTRQAERELTVLNELGLEFMFSLLPEPSSMPVRGGHLTEGDRLTTPLTVESVLTEEPAIEIHADTSQLHLLVFDLVGGEAHVIEHGDAAAGDSIPVDNPSDLALVVAAGIVGGKPFEGFTTFMRPSRLEVEVSAPETVRPREEVTLEIETNAERAVPVVLTVRDRRLTRTDTPSSGLAASLKRGVESATKGMAEWGIEPLDLQEQLFPSAIPSGIFEGEMVDVLFDLEDGLEIELGADEPAAVYVAAAEPTAGGMAELLGEMAAEDIEVAGTEDVGIPVDEGSPVDAVAPPPRAEFPPVLFVGLVEVEGRAEVPVWTGDGTGSFLIEAFAYDAGDWQAVVRDLVIDLPVRADLEIPPMVRAGDDVTGRLRVTTASGRALVSLTRDGDAVELRSADGATVQGEISALAALTFAVAPGAYEVRVEDAESGEIDSMEAVVSEPGRLRSHARELVLLSEGESITLEDAGAVSLRVLPGLDEPFDLLVETTATYTHLCCEQTAAKILSAVAMYLASGDDGRRSKAEGIIRKGIAWEESMFRPGAGFLMYPESPHVSDHYSQLAARYLWKLDRLAEIPDLSPGLRDAVKRGSEMADDAGAFHGIEKIPSKPATLDDAYAALVGGGNRSDALTVIDRFVDFSGNEVRLRNGGHAVASRAGLAYVAAGLLAAGDVARGLRAANVVAGEFGENGALYSTVDSVGAIALLIQLRIRSVISSKARVRVNGEEMDLSEAIDLGDRVESVESIEGTVAVQALAIREEDWEEYGAGFEIRVGLRENGDRRPSLLQPGRRVDLVVGLEDGYRVGDLVHVDLPACLSWMRGGGLVKRFSVDFEGRDEIRIPLAVTGTAPGGQHFAVCVRNMFEEERRANPGLVRVATDVVSGA